MKLMVGIPAYGGTITTQTFRSLFVDLTKLALNGWEIDVVDSITGAEIDTIRNKIISRFAASDCDELIMVDTDVTWGYDSMLRLLAAPIDKGGDIIAGIYPKKQEPIEYPFDPKLYDNGTVRLNEDGLILCNHVPAGFLRIPKGTAQKLIEENQNLQYVQLWGYGEKDDYPVYSLFEKSWGYDECSGLKTRRSEDVAFCKRVLDIGGDVFAHPDIGMGHIGQKCFIGKIDGNSTVNNHKGAS